MTVLKLVGNLPPVSCCLTGLIWRVLKVRSCSILRVTQECIEHQTGFEVSSSSENHGKNLESLNGPELPTADCFGSPIEQTIKIMITNVECTDLVSANRLAGKCESVKLDGQPFITSPFKAWAFSVQFL